MVYSNHAFERMVDTLSDSVPLSDSEYMGEDGLLHCAVCHDNVQTVVEFLGIRKTVRCICSCKEAELKAEEERMRRQDYDRNRKICFGYADMADCTFENDDRQKPALSKAMEAYAERFHEFLKIHKGLVLYGPVGTGKSYYAACIANRLIDKGYKVRMTNFAELANILESKFDGKQEFMESLNRYDLLIVDDLGAERNSASGYMQEIVFNIIDSRCRAKLPFIVTTNLTADELKNPTDMRYKRIYDRVLERCHPVEVAGQSRRRQALRETHADVKAMLGL